MLTAGCFKKIALFAHQIELTNIGADNFNCSQYYETTYLPNILPSISERASIDKTGMVTSCIKLNKNKTGFLNFTYSYLSDKCTVKCTVSELTPLQATLQQKQRLL